jgi:hypothetical protein
MALRLLSPAKLNAFRSVCFFDKGFSSPCIFYTVLYSTQLVLVNVYPAKGWQSRDMGTSLNNQFDKDAERYLE